MSSLIASSISLFSIISLMIEFISSLFLFDRISLGIIFISLIIASSPNKLLKYKFILIFVSVKYSFNLSLFFVLVFFVNDI